MTPTITNLHRAGWAKLALSTFVKETENGATVDQLGKEGLSGAISDLICDLLHLALIKKLDSEHVLAQARANFDVELTEEL